MLQTASRWGRPLAIGLASLTLAACEEPPPPPVEAPRPVRLFEVGSGETGETREYPGRIKAGQYSEVSFDVPGRVTEFVYTEGAPVERNAVLARIDPRDYQAQYDSAKAKLEHARSERDRFKEMYEKDVKPFSEYELRLRLFESDEAKLRIAEKALNDTVLRAPFGGVMARKLVEEFENVLAKQPVAVMQNDRLLEIKVSVPERDLAEGETSERTADELTSNLRPRVVVSSIPDREFPARVKELANVADPTTRTFEATFLFDHPENVNILGGMTAKVVIDVSSERNAGMLLIPSNAAIAGEGDAAKVWVIDTDTLAASGREVTLGEIRGGSVQVTSGLSRGETIAISGVHKLRDGMKVRRYDR